MNKKPLKAKETYYSLLEAYKAFNEEWSSIPCIDYWGNNPTPQRERNRIHKLQEKVFENHPLMKPFIIINYDYEYIKGSGFKRIEGSESPVFYTGSFRKKLNKLFFKFWGKV